MVWLISKIAIRLVIFGLVFWWVARRDDRIHIAPRWAYPLIAIAFGLLNASLYWLLKGVVVVASLWTLSLLAPLIANAALLWGMTRVLDRFERRPLQIDGLLPMFWLALYLTAAHGALYLVLDVIVG